MEGAANDYEMATKLTVRRAARLGMNLSGTDAQALEFALQQAEREIAALRAERDRYREALKNLVEHESPSDWPWSEGLWNEAREALGQGEEEGK